MSNSIIKRAVGKLVRSEAFLEIFTDHLMVHLEQQLHCEAAGDSLYIPKAGSLERKEERNQLIRSRFTGKNYEQLGREFSLTERQIRNICDKKK